MAANTFLYYSHKVCSFVYSMGSYTLPKLGILFLAVSGSGARAPSFISAMATASTA
jgi:hypothetical protein